MRWLLAVRHLALRRSRAAVLLAGYGLGVGVMIVLLSVGEAMLSQARDATLVGGGEVTVLPAGIDIEAMRTGGISGMYFKLERARYLVRQAIGGPRHARMVETASPALVDRLLYLATPTGLLPVRATGELPGRARAVGAGIEPIHGTWADTRADSAWVQPTPQQLYDGLDHFHMPAVDDSTWAEWHYFNVVVSEDEWWYVTVLVAGRIGFGDWGGQVLATHRRPDGRHDAFTADVPSRAIQFDTVTADVHAGPASVVQRNGTYRLTVAVPDLALDLRIVPSPYHYFPPVELGTAAQPSGYVVPALVAQASGKICVRGRCSVLTGADAYHDHNWGTWRDVQWEWGAARGSRTAILYGAVRTRSADPPSLFVALVDSMGVRQVFRAPDIAYSGTVKAGDSQAPGALSFTATQGDDTLRLSASIRAARSSGGGAAGEAPVRWFLQMRGRWKMDAVLAGRMVSDSGWGFFETWRENRE